MCVSSKGDDFMPTTMQQFLATATQKAAADLETAFLRIPEDKRSWSPMGQARTALNQMAECALLNGGTAELIQTRVFPADFDMAAFGKSLEELAQDWSAVQAMLHANTPKVAAAIQAVDDADLEITIQMPWGPMTLGQIIAYPYWNMSYHEAQINYIASMLGCLS
jgi:uncharacterized damage-inducible protein DinB